MKAHRHPGEDACINGHPRCSTRWGGPCSKECECEDCVNFRKHSYKHKITVTLDLSFDVTDGVVVRTVADDALRAAKDLIAERLTRYGLNEKGIKLHGQAQVFGMENMK